MKVSRRRESENRGGEEKNGYTLMELIMVILLLSLLAVAVVVKWPSGMDAEAAVKEVTRAIRYAQHMALTRAWSDASQAWGIVLAGNRYYVGRADANCVADCTHAGCGEEMFCGRFLLGDSTITLSPAGTTILFNGLGEPIDASGNLLANTVITIGASSSVQVTVCRETGYVLEGGGCP